jgi:uncharacterized protein YbcI
MAQESSPGNHGQLRYALEAAMVALFKRYYGKGPAAAKALLRDEYVVLVLEGGLTRNEETLVERGGEEEVRRFRLAFEESVRDEAKQIVAELTGRRVLSYHSQIVFHPPRAFELFVLGEEHTRG